MLRFYQSYILIFQLPQTVVGTSNPITKFVGTGSSRRGHRGQCQDRGHGPFHVANHVHSTREPLGIWWLKHELCRNHVGKAGHNIYIYQPPLGYLPTSIQTILSKLHSWTSKYFLGAVKPDADSLKWCLNKGNHGGITGIMEIPSGKHTKNYGNLPWYQRVNQL